MLRLSACRENQKRDDDDIVADGLIETESEHPKGSLDAPAPYVARGAAPARHGERAG